jgi:hypothetical protein
VLELGRKRASTFFPWVRLEGVLPFLEQHGGGSNQWLGQQSAHCGRHARRLFEATRKQTKTGMDRGPSGKAGVVAIDRDPPAHLRSAVKKHKHV